MIKVEVDLNLDPELLELINKVDTKLSKEIYYGKVLLFAEQYEIGNIQSDIQTLIAERDKIQKVYSTVGYPYEAIEILRSGTVENHNSRSQSASGAGK